MVVQSLILFIIIITTIFNYFQITFNEKNSDEKIENLEDELRIRTLFLTNKSFRSRFLLRNKNKN